jgi:hypothetical protein
MANKFASASSQEKEPKTNYVDYKVGGAKHCFSCEYFHKETSSCSGPHMEELSKRPKLPNGEVKVHPIGLCRWWEEKD